jgi:hypothetical protein
MNMTSIDGTTWQYPHYQFSYDPIQPLLESNNPAIIYFTKRDLLGKNVDPIETIWGLPHVRKILKKQQPDGSWDPGKKNIDFGGKYALTETWRQLRFLVDQYEMNKSDCGIQKACEFVFSCQSEEGDIRCILANQYAPYYTGAILYLLIKAGYQNDNRIKKGIQWLIDMRQNDGGWVIGSPGMMNRTWKEVSALTSKWTPEPERNFDKDKPFSAAGTGMAIRALAVHPIFQKSKETEKAAFLLKSKFLKKDNWSWYEHPDNWIRFQFPYWWNHLISALDMVSLIGIPKEDTDIKTGLQWLIDHQEKNGLWKVSYSKIHKISEKEKSSETRLWITLCICRIFKRYFGS